MRILYVHQHFTTPAGAGGIRSYQMAQKAISCGHQVTMVCGAHANSKSALTGEFRHGVRRGAVDGIDLIELDLPYSNQDSFVQRAITFLRFALTSVYISLTEKYDILFATTTPLTAALPGIAARWLRGKPFVFEVRDLWPELPKAMGVIRNPLILMALRFLEWAAYKSAHRLVGLSPGIVEGIRHNGGRDKAIAHIPNGCDIELFATEPVGWQPEGVEDGDLMLLFAGAHGLANGLDAVVDCASELQKRGATRIKFVLVGQGMLKPALVSRAQSQKLRNIIFVNTVPKMKLLSLMRRADVGIQCLANIPAFYFGTSPNKFFDYIAAGRPVIINYPGWLAELVTSNNCGVAVPPEDPRAFADVVQRMERERESLPEMGTNALGLARSTFDRDILASRWVEFVVNNGSVRGTL